MDSWTWWKELKNPTARLIMSWIDALVFALVAVYFFNIYFFQNYNIPSSSLEKSLLVGDYLVVNKMAYGRACHRHRFTCPWYSTPCPNTSGWEAARATSSGPGGSTSV